MLMVLKKIQMKQSEAESKSSLNMSQKQPPQCGLLLGLYDILDSSWARWHREIRYSNVNIQTILLRRTNP